MNTQNTQPKPAQVGHTPGPWKFLRMGLPFNGYEVTAFEQYTGICRVPFTGDVDTANARLIAAAPELLEACKVALDAMREQQMVSAKRGEQVSYCIGRALQKCDKSISRAEGRL